MESHDMHTWLEQLDLDRNGLAREVERNIREHRMGDFEVCLQCPDGHPLRGVPLAMELQEHDFLFGCNAFMAGGFEQPEQNAQYDDIFRRVFNQAVLPFYWRDDEPTPGVYRFAPDSPRLYRRPPPDWLLGWCERVAVSPKGHSLVWDGSGLPDWLPLEPEHLDPAVTRRIQAIARHFAGRIPVWDVVNEFLSRPRRRFMKDYHLHYFKMAEELFPGCALIANEDTERTWDSFTGDSSRFYLYLQHLLLSGCKVDALGMQYHLFSRKDILHERAATSLNAANLLACQSFYAGFGKPIHISEISVPSYNEPGEAEEIQARMTEALFKIWFSGKENASIVWWNLVDGYASCLPQWGWDENLFGAGLFRKDFTPKPAFDVVERLICKEWHTATSATTDERGIARFSGFYGTYRLSARINGTVTEQTAGFHKRSSAIFDWCLSP